MLIQVKNPRVIAAVGIEAELSTTEVGTPAPAQMLADVDLAADAEEDGDDPDWDIEDEGTIMHLESDVNETDSSLIDVGPGVVCGGHSADSCANCPQGHGAAWCNGDCSWQNNQCQALPSITQNNPYGCYEGQCKARTCSIHFNYMRPAGARTPSWYFNQFKPTSTSDATFFAMSTTGYGYAGIQTVSKDPSVDKDRLVLCSIWDQSNGRAKMEKCGAGVVCMGFGGEGTGAKAKWYFDWQLGKNYAFMLHRRDAGNGRIEHTCWFYAEELESSHPGGWKHIATATSGANGYGTTFADSGSFLEQWTHAHSDESRQADYGPAFYKNEDGEWLQAKKTRFSLAYLPERVKAQLVRIDHVSAGLSAATKRLFMQTGGTAKPSAALQSARELAMPDAPCGLPAPVYLFETTKADHVDPAKVAVSSAVRVVRPTCRQVDNSACRENGKPDLDCCAKHNEASCASGFELKFKGTHCHMSTQWGVVLDYDCIKKSA